MVSYKNLKTVKQIAETNPGVFTEASLRWMIFNSKGNGMERAIIKVGSRVFIDTERFNEWLEIQRLAS